MTEYEAAHRIGELLDLENMEFHRNPGGGEYWHPQYGRLQVDVENCVDDYFKLFNWLTKKKRESFACFE